jgi:predicted HicB family RNase H-like nuclease
MDYVAKALRDMGAEPLEMYEPVGPRKRGRPKTNTPNRARLNLTVDHDLPKLLQQAAKEGKVSVSQYVNQLLVKHFQKA